MSDIAIVGIGCRFAGGIDSPESFWDFVVDKRDGVVEIPADRWDYRRYYDPEPRTPGRSYTKRGAFMTGDPWAFDPDFFGISPREATVLDPQQRLLLEVTWEALDDAGIAGAAAGGSVGVYVGGFVVDQSVIGVVGPALFHTDMHTPASASYTMLSNRIAYALNLVGPAITVDTACSSSLVAFHLACQALDNGDCRVALAGGVNVMLQPETFVLMCKGGFLATDGRCKSFDATADGYGRGEGAGMVALKRLDDAVRDGDRIYAVVKATGSNQDGRTTAITVPNVDSQEALAREVCARSGLAPDEITYVEAHGTGTLVGDPVEARALGRVFGARSGRAGTVGMGSVKATIGHTEAAAGVASVIKAALAIRHRTLPPQGWLDTPNPDIPFAELGLHLQVEAQPLPAGAAPMAVAVNGFGYGGTNAHAILQEYRPVGAAAEPPAPEHLGILPVSGRSTRAVRDLAGRFADLIAGGADPDRLAEAAWTRMAHHPFRTGVLVGGSTDDLVRDLRAYADGEGRDAARTVVSAAAEPVFVFSGMGPQHWRMGRELLDAGGVFADTAALIDAEFRAVAGWSIVEELRRPEAESRVTRTDVAQPANFLVQVGLVRELAALGITPAAVVGHSVGEVTAAYVSGVLTLPEAVRVAYHRSRLQATTAGSGGMLAVGLTRDKAVALLGDDPRVDIAAVNSPTAVTLAGAVDQLDEIAERLTAEGVFARMLRVEVPYHSRLMDPIEDELRRALADLAPRQPGVPLYSTVTGDQVTAGDWDAGYWWSNVRRPVRFHDAVTRLIGAGSRVFLEIGPHPVLSGNIREALIDTDVNGTTVPTLDRGRSDHDSLRHTVIGLHAAGVLDRDLLFPPSRPATPHLPLPRYPWQRTRLHAPLPLFEQARLGTPGAYPMLGDPDLEGRSQWLLQVGTELLPWLSDHVVNGIKIMPGAAYLDAALSATAARTGSKQVALEQVRFVAPLIMGAPDVPLVALQVEEASGRFLLRSRSATGTAWTLHASGRTLTGGHEQRVVEVPEIDRGVDIDPEMFYAGLAAAGLQYGPAFRRVTSVRVGRDVVVATVDGAIAADSGHLAHPAVVDAAMQCAAMLFADERINEGVMVPVGVNAVRLLGELPETITVVARRDPGARLRADVDLLDPQHRLVARLAGLQIGALKPGDDPLHRMADFYYADTVEERDPVDPATLAAEPATTLLLALGEGTLALALADAVPGAQLFTALPGDADLEAGLADRLRAVDDGGGRLHVCVVAGDIPDDLAALWTLKRIAVAVDEYANPPVEGGAPQSVFGDGRVHCTLITEHAFSLPGSPVPPDPARSALAGARRVLLNEQTPLRWRLIDVETATPVSAVVAELAVPGAFTGDNCDEILLRDGKRWAPVITKPLPERLEELDTATPLTDPDANFALEMPRNRLLSQLAWRRCPRPAPGPGEVEIRMHVIGLNYKDPLKVIGLLGERELAPTYFGTVPGMEGVGTVVRVGPDITDVAVGDLVAVASKGMMRRFAVVSRQLVVVVPPDTDPGHCTSTIAFGTAEYALLDLARLEAGETVLVHGAAGGVGTAAIQVAKARGARIIGTASTEERRAHVLAMGADHAVNSRSLDFVDDVLALTGGKGADVIVSSAPGEILRQNFHAAAEFGRIVEVGKADIYTGGLLELANFDKNLAYYSMDLDRLVAVDPQRLAALLERVFDKVTTGAYTPLPYQMYDTDDVAKAFEETLRSSRPARIALRMDAPAPAVRPLLPEVEIDPAASYLITGGFGGFGLAIGRWLTLRGARRLVLLGRGGATTETARRQLEAWRTMGVEVVEELADVTDPRAVAAVVGRAHRPEHPLRGVFHAAGAVADNRISQLGLGQLDKVYRPKVHGAQVVHAAVAEAGITLDMFVLCSSGGSMYGIYGQFSYCAANVAVEQLAERWARAGERALCVGWGHLSGVTGGMAADETAEKYLDLVGFGPIDMADATAYLEQTLRLGATRAAIIPTDWAKLTGTFPQLTRTGRTSALAQASAKDTSELARLRGELAAMDDAKRGPYIARKMAEELAVVMSVPVESIDMTVPVPELGLDSLMAVELGARVTKTLGIDLMSLQMGRSFSLEQAGPKVAELILASEPGAAQAVPAPAPAAPRPEPLDERQLAGPTR
ncbi:type I polyketide synthase [Nocardia thailandica]|uniref:Type I polyketide synthase n=1 Tax=Nocardia thailandica TaxID=257275 RepID=A0ABW6PV48_9NOCA